MEGSEGFAADGDCFEVWEVWEVTRKERRNRHFQDEPGDSAGLIK